MFQPARTGEPFENRRHWFDEAVMAAEIRNFRWHGTSRHCRSVGAQELGDDKTVRTSRSGQAAWGGILYLERVSRQVTRVRTA